MTAGSTVSRQEYNRASQVIRVIRIPNSQGQNVARRVQNCDGDGLDFGLGSVVNLRLMRIRSYSDRTSIQQSRETQSVRSHISSFDILGTRRLEDIAQRLDRGRDR